MNEVTDNWEKFTGQYEKQPMDIICKDGTHALGCWPNAGYFNSMLFPNKCRGIPFKDVIAVKRSDSGTQAVFYMGGDLNDLQTVPDPIPVNKTIET